MTTPDFPDWSQTVGTLETDTALGAQPDVIHRNQAVFYDTSQLASVAIQFVPPFIASGKRYVANFVWRSTVGGVQVAQQTMTFHDASSYQRGVDFFLIQLVARGAQLDVEIDAGDDLANSSVYAWGSTRSVPNDRLTVGSFDIGALLATFGGVLTPGASTVMYVPPTQGGIVLEDSIGVSTKVRMTVAGISKLGGLTVAQLWQGDQSASAAIYQPLPIGWTGWEVTVTNNDTVNRSPGVTIWDLS